MKARLYLLWLIITLCPAVSAQNRVTVKDVVYPNAHNMPAEQRELLKIKYEPFFLNRSWANTPFHTAFVYAKGHMFRIDSEIHLLKEDLNMVYISMNFEDLCVSNPVLGAYIDSTPEKWTIPLHNGKGRGHLKKGIICSVPLASRGKELFLHADAHIDLRDEAKSSITYKIKAEKVDKPFLYEEWPTKEEFQNKMWLKYKDHEGNTHQLYLHGKEKLIVE